MCGTVKSFAAKRTKTGLKCPNQPAVTAQYGLLDVHPSADWSTLRWRPSGMYDWGSLSTVLSATVFVKCSTKNHPQHQSPSGTYLGRLGRPSSPRWVLPGAPRRRESAGSGTFSMGRPRQLLVLCSSAQLDSCSLVVLRANLELGPMVGATLTTPSPSHPWILFLFTFPPATKFFFLLWLETRLEGIKPGNRFQESKIQQINHPSERPPDPP